MLVGSQLYLKRSSDPNCGSKVLVLSSTSIGWNDVVLIDENGHHDKVSCIKTGDKPSTFKLCSVTWQNQFYLIGGGGDDFRMIQQLVDHRLSRVGNLKFDHHWGSCNNVKDEKLFLYRVFFCCEHSVSDRGRTKNFFQKKSFSFYEILRN